MRWGLLRQLECRSSPLRGSGGPPPSRRWPSAASGGGQSSPTTPTASPAAQRPLLAFFYLLVTFFVPSRYSEGPSEGAAHATEWPAPPCPVRSPALPLTPLQTAGCGLHSTSALSRSIAQRPPQEPRTLTAACTLRNTATPLTPNSGVHCQKEKKFSQFEIGQNSRGCCYKLKTRPSGDPAIRVTGLPVLQPSSPPLNLLFPPQ